MQCPVCYEEITLKNIVNTKCNHSYCSDCFWKWANTKNNCPVCREPILKECHDYNKLVMTHDELRNNITLMMDEEWQYNNSISFLEHEKDELEKDVFKLQCFKRHPEKYMKEYMEKREIQFKNVRNNAEIHKRLLIEQLNGYYMLYDNYNEVLNQLRNEKENDDFDMELEGLDLAIDLLDIDSIEPFDFEFATPPPTLRSDIQSPPPLLRLASRDMSRFPQ